MSGWPREIADAEVIARGIRTPHHVTRTGKLKAAAYKPPYETDEVSTMRANWIGADACKQHAKDLETPADRKVYTGLAILSARQIRQSGASIIDTREEFLGHADIKHGIVPRRGDPLPAPQLKVLQDRAKALADLANYFTDPDPPNANWTGPSLHYKA
jgi:hypothetical protein